jgi:beta-lactam-binding protein with PASTA domain
VLDQSPPEGILVQAGGGRPRGVQGHRADRRAGDVVGRSRQEAEVLLEAAKLVRRAAVEVDGNVPPAGCSRSARRRARSSTSARRSCSPSPPARSRCPDVAGRTQDEATAACSSRFSVAIELRDDTPPGIVLAQDR